MKKALVLVSLVSTFIYAQNLSQILDVATQNNRIIKSKDFTISSKKKDSQVVDSQFYPQINMGANYTTLNKKSSGSAGDTYELYGNISYDIYDFGERKNRKNSLNAVYESSKHDKEGFLKTLHLNIVEDFFSIKNAQVQLDALVEKNIQLKAELERIKKFYEVGSATKDDIDKLNAEYSNNIYDIDTLKHQLLSLKELFILKVGVKVDSFENSEFLKPKKLEKDENDYIKVLKENINALEYSAKSLNSKYKPKFKLENRYSVYEYDRDGIGYEEDVDKQNKLILTMNMRLYDNGFYKKQKQSLFLQKKAIEEQIKQEELSQDINIELANSRIKTIEAQIKSAKDSLVAASSTFETVRKKFEIGSVDNIAFLDALSVKTSSKAQYETAKNNLQIAYAKYYYYLNKHIKDFIK